MLTKHTKLLAVRLPESEKRRIKSLAASQGLSLQEAVHQALAAWASRLQPEAATFLGPLPDAPAGADVEKSKRPNRARKSAQGRRR